MKRNDPRELLNGLPRPKAPTELKHRVLSTARQGLEAIDAGIVTAARKKLL